MILKYFKIIFEILFTMLVWWVTLVTTLLSLKEILFYSVVQMKIGSFKNAINVLNFIFALIFLIIIIIFVLFVIKIINKLPMH